MEVIKRNGVSQEVSFDKVIWRLKVLCNMEPILKNVDVIEIAQKVCSQIYSGIDTYKLDELASEICILYPLEPDSILKYLVKYYSIKYFNTIN